MAQVNNPGPTPIPHTTPQPSSSSPSPLPAKLTAQIDLLVSLHLHSWPALSLAVTSHWGGPSSADKRDWLAGEISTLITSSPAQLHDVGDLEEVLLQVMVDEFEVVVDDDSAATVAKGIWGGVQKLRVGDVAELTALREKWEEKRRRSGGREDVPGIVRGEDKDGEETDWDDEDDEEEEFNGFDDTEMSEAPPLVAKKEKLEPEIDEEGFTKVVGKKKR